MSTNPGAIHINMDAIPYLFENLHRAKARPKHVDFIVNGFASFYRFSSGRLLTPEPADLSGFEFSISEPEAKIHAASVVSELLSGPLFMQDETHLLWHRLDVHLALLLIAIEFYSNRHPTLAGKLRWIATSLEKSIGRIPDRELVLAFRAFQTPILDPFIAEQWPVPYNKKENIIDLVRNMAWDISFFRTMQTWASQKNLGDFSIPYFLTFDRKLGLLNESYSYRVLLIDDQDRNVFALPKHNLTFLLQEAGCWAALADLFEPRRIEKRLSAHVSYEEALARCLEAEKELHMLIYGTDSARITPPEYHERAPTSLPAISQD